MTTLMSNTIFTLVRKGFNVHHAATKEAAIEAVMRLIPQQASVGFGGSMTIRSLGLYNTLKTQQHPVYWHWESDVPKPDVFGHAASADVYLTSTNAITADGCLVNIDGTGNRVAAMISGPKQVIIVAGVNKLVEGGVPQAIARIKSVACPMNARRLGLQTPCGVDGKCDLSRCEKGMCNVTSIIEKPMGAHPITIVLVDEELGY